ncbi:hypothetical protein BS50DRAFT_397490 [Corynespora cassiicola Philippines]|uniref:Peptidase M43 pregnancy-associated plasma-A domain-containing protein n=1 Tax=Corynespora cassiicola Philippines TaxID=1448308 RepID=A0A2T2NK04_CORCC|nr:hypothetical protein BS50DRAFT_397490 [Corynespora cassiicola Philippines]
MPSMNSQNKRTDNSSVIIPIETVLQILSANNTVEGGDIPDHLIEEQIFYLNEAFRPAGFSFVLSEVVRTVNERWYHNLRSYTDIHDEVATLRKGGNATLNIYTYGTDYYPGWSWGALPEEMAWTPQLDGIFLHRLLWRGAGDANWDLGGSLVHEAGHWFGLFHTASMSCEESWDYVDDTPMELISDVIGGCDIGRDTCPDQPGLDPIHNWMGFSNDPCRNSFTPGQIQRMREQMAKFRQVVYPGIDVDKIPNDGE